jgi:hypothetical protein
VVSIEIDDRLIDAVMEDDRLCARHRLSADREEMERDLAALLAWRMVSRESPASQIWDGARLSSIEGFGAHPDHLAELMSVDCDGSEVDEIGEDEIGIGIGEGLPNDYGDDGGGVAR